MRRRNSSPAIANIVGAVFFILIVVLMVGALANIFQTFSGSVQAEHTSEEATLQQQQQSLAVQNLVFGGQTSYGTFDYSARGSVALNPNAAQNPILPISNMNFTSNMDGWADSRHLSQVTDSAFIQNSPEYLTYNTTASGNTFFPSQPQQFNLNVTNKDSPGPFDITKVSILVDQNLVVPLAASQPLGCLWGQPTVVGNNITWVAPGLFGIIPGRSSPPLCFNWVATVPTIYGTYYNTVVISWLNGSSNLITDVAIATVNATVTSQSFASGTSGTSTASILRAPAGATPGGATAGYDGNALLTSSESGPGSMYVNFRPTFDSVPIADGQQLTSSANFTTSFSLGQSSVAGLDLSKCCALTFATSLDSINAPRNSLVLYQAYLTNPPIPIFSGVTTHGTNSTMLQDASAGWTPNEWVGDYLLYTSGPAVGQFLKVATNSATSITTSPFDLVPTTAGADTFIITLYPKGVTIELPIGSTCGNSPVYYINPTTDNDFNPSGWVYDYSCFSPSTITPLWLNGTEGWYKGTYTLTMEVTMILPGASAMSSGYPPQLSVHLDDIGLALAQQTTTGYGSSTFSIPTGLDQNQIQGVEVAVNATGAKGSTTMYVYVADNSRPPYNPPLWVQLGSTSFTYGTEFDSMTSLPNAAYYVGGNGTMSGGHPVVGSLNVRVNVTSPSNATTKITVRVSAVIQTFNTTRAVVELKNLGDAPVHPISMVITGPGAARSVNFTSAFYMGPGERLMLPLDYDWIPGQIYTVTVTTATGMTFSSSFTAPLA